MPRAAGDPGRPADHVTGDYLFGALDPRAPVGVAEMVHVSRRLRDALDEAGRSVTALARDTGLDRTTIHDLLAGRSVCDVVTLARLEHAVGQRLYPESGP